jgi:opacity protein-like surface antigen
VLLKCFGIAAVAGSMVGGGAAGVGAQARDRASGAFSASFIQTRPVGELGANIGSGYGIAGGFLLPLDRGGLFSLRADLGAAEYGHELKRTAFSESVGGRVEVDVRTTNTVVPGSVGVQLAAPSGLIRPYVTGGVGAVVFLTDSRVEPTGGGVPLASMVNQWDVAPAWTVGGGVYVPLVRGARTVLLDVSAQYIRGGRAEFLAPGSIVDLPDGRVTITPQESGTRMLALRFGARIGL